MGVHTLKEGMTVHVCGDGKKVHSVKIESIYYTFLSGQVNVDYKLENGEVESLPMDEFASFVIR